MNWIYELILVITLRFGFDRALVVFFFRCSVFPRQRPCCSGMQLHDNKFINMFSGKNRYSQKTKVFGMNSKLFKYAWKLFGDFPSFLSILQMKRIHKIAFFYRFQILIETDSVSSSQRIALIRTFKFSFRAYSVTFRCLVIELLIET